MLYFIVVFFCGTILYGSEQDNLLGNEIRMQNEKILFASISKAIQNQYIFPQDSHAKIKEPRAIKDATRAMNGGALPIPRQAKHEIVSLLTDAFPKDYDEAEAVFCRYVEKKNIYRLSAEKTLEILSKQYEEPSATQLAIALIIGAFEPRYANVQRKLKKPFVRSNEDA